MSIHKFKAADTVLVQLHSNGLSVWPNPNGVSGHCAPIDVVGVEIVVDDLGIKGIPRRNGGVGVNFCHTNCVVLDGSIGVLEGWRVPGESERSGGLGSWR